VLQKSVVMTAAWLEMVVGATLLTAPDYPCQLLFAAKPEGVGTVLARVAGLGLFALGIACLPSKATGSCRRAVFGLFVFNFGVALLLAWVGIATTFSGVLLWPTIVLHAVIAAALLPQLLTFKIVGLAGGEERAGKVLD
jgi:heme A synthase